MSAHLIQALTLEANHAIDALSNLSPARQAALVSVSAAEKFNAFHAKLLAMNPDLTASMPKKIPFTGTGAARAPVVNHIELRVFWKQALRAIPAPRVAAFQSHHAGVNPLAETRFKENFF